jgi:hypothetical protein
MVIGAAQFTLRANSKGNIMSKKGETWMFAPGFIAVIIGVVMPVVALLFLLDTSAFNRSHDEPALLVVCLVAGLALLVLGLIWCASCAKDGQLRPH